MDTCTAKHNLTERQFLSMFHFGNDKIDDQVEDPFYCLNCHQSFIPESELFESVNCDHKYCIFCASKQINNSLSLLNRIPKCIYPFCNQSILINTKMHSSIQPLLYEKYKRNPNITQHTKDIYLINGYIKTIINYIYIPNDIISLIYDYWLVNYLKINPIKQPDCSKCNSNGYITKSITLGQCIECDGNGTIKESDDWYMNMIRSPAKYYKECIHCDGSGAVWIDVDGFKVNMYDITASDIIWNSNNASLKCTCSKCDNKYLQINYNKLCNQQTLCRICFNYSPNDMMVCWSNCEHMNACLECIYYYIDNEISNRRIPICLNPKCQQPLSVNDSKLYCGETISKKFKLLTKCIQMKQLIYRKNDINHNQFDDRYKIVSVRMRDRYSYLLWNKPVIPQIVKLLTLTSIRMEDIKYFKVDLFDPYLLFDLCLNTEANAHKIKNEIKKYGFHSAHAWIQYSKKDDIKCNDIDDDDDIWLFELYHLADKVRKYHLTMESAIQGLKWRLNIPIIPSHLADAVAREVLNDIEAINPYLLKPELDGVFGCLYKHSSNIIYRVQRWSL